MMMMIQQQIISTHTSTSFSLILVDYTETWMQQQKSSGFMCLISRTQNLCSLSTRLQIKTEIKRIISSKANCLQSTQFRVCVKIYCFSCNKHVFCDKTTKFLNQNQYRHQERYFVQPNLTHSAAPKYRFFFVP